jgi:hypothetical protein
MDESFTILGSELFTCMFESIFVPGFPPRRLDFGEEDGKNG